MLCSWCRACVGRGRRQAERKSWKTRSLANAKKAILQQSKVGYGYTSRAAAALVERLPCGHGTAAKFGGGRMPVESGLPLML